MARRLEKSDLAARVAWFNSPEIYASMPLDVPFSLDATEQWYAQTVLNPTRRDFCFDVVESDGAAETRLTGAMAGLTDIDYRHRRAKLYVVVNPDHFREGIGRASVCWLCNFGFLGLDLNRVYLYTLAGNIGAAEFYSALGFAREGILRQHRYHLGGFVDRCVYGLLRSEWEEQCWMAKHLAFQANLSAGGAS